MIPNSHELFMGPHLELWIFALLSSPGRSLHFHCLVSGAGPLQRCLSEIFMHHEVIFGSQFDIWGASAIA